MRSLRATLRRSCGVRRRGMMARLGEARVVVRIGRAAHAPTVPPATDPAARVPLVAALALARAAPAAAQGSRRANRSLAKVAL